MSQRLSDEVENGTAVLRESGGELMIDLVGSAFSFGYYPPSECTHILITGDSAASVAEASIQSLEGQVQEQGGVEIIDLDSKGALERAAAAYERVVTAHKSVARRHLRLSPRDPKVYLPHVVLVCRSGLLSDLAVRRDSELLRQIMSVLVVGRLTRRSLVLINQTPDAVPAAITEAYQGAVPEDLRKEICPLIDTVCVANTTNQAVLRTRFQ